MTNGKNDQADLSARQVAIVYYGKERAGRLIKNPDGPNSGYDFEYDTAYIEKLGTRPISLGMPLRKEKYQSKTLFPFFEGLLPEGWLLELTSQTLKIDPKDKFALLLHTGGDTVGAVTVRLER
jgi:serine/threonine-protein kinase HipA